jgi:hypothetical protein
VRPRRRTITYATLVRSIPLLKEREGTMDTNLVMKVAEHLTQNPSVQEKENKMTEEQKFVWWLVGFLDSKDNVDIERIKEKLADVIETEFSSSHEVVYKKNGKAQTQFENRRLEFLLSEEKEKVKQLLAALDTKAGTGQVAEGKLE